MNLTKRSSYLYHQIRSGDGWAGRRGVGRLNRHRETKIKGKNADMEGEMKQKVINRRKVLARERKAEAEQSGASCDRAKRGIKHVHVDGR